MIRDVSFKIVHRTIEQQCQLSALERVDIYMHPRGAQLGLAWADGSTYIGTIDSEDVPALHRWVLNKHLNHGWPAATVHTKEQKA